jgi:hypothetical protein
LNGVTTIAIAPRIASIIILGQIKSMIYTFWLLRGFNLKLIQDALIQDGL